MSDKIYSHERYEQLIRETVTEILKLGQLKGGEYAGDFDRLANFRRGANNLGVNFETIWAVYTDKHWCAILQFIKDKQAGKERTRLEPIAGRVDDMILYLLLFKCMLDEQGMLPSQGA